ncbi:Ribose-5-phosphate isomerase A [Desulfovibrio sp. X2]|uniref:ribose-5-phosphate isomerase RpiA n=1 Tax=Desulfovibrio sp. X2 TaxID=941449 RepID=UPI000358BE6F|nr:ribose-5-phosphate isomerase RpiA [Desulfovibrio sp. X2]EPR41096.1 Ribose-5-phosphate isomerase A [Desulfovibrio sp. X2]
MPHDADATTRFKRQAGEAAAQEVRSDMVVGLGHGSTAVWALREIGRRLAAGEITNVRGVPCSRAVAEDARAAGIPLLDLPGPDDEATGTPFIDLTIDGADEVDPALNLIKGGGGALLREKIVAQASRREIIVADADKLTSALGTRFALPVEVLADAAGLVARFLRRLGAEPALRRRKDGSPFVTDAGNHILDCRLSPLAAPGAAEDLAAKLGQRAGIVAHGLFLKLCDELVVAGPDGLKRLSPPAPTER